MCVLRTRGGGGGWEGRLPQRRASPLHGSHSPFPQVVNARSACPRLPSYVFNPPPERVPVPTQVLPGSCYCQQPATRLRGSAAVELLVLRALGLAALPLPVREWQGLSGDEQRRRYLQARLAAAVG